MSKKPDYPFAAIVGQQSLKTALSLSLANPGLSGLLIRGEKGSAKSTAVRGLAGIMPKIEVIEDCPFALALEEAAPGICGECWRKGCREAVLNAKPLTTQKRKIRVVELPLGASEDRLTGSLNLERALRDGEMRFKPGLLAQAHRGILYVDEVNLLPDHLVDLLLDAAAMGVNFVERDGVSYSHPAKFCLVGTMNPEEGELRPQLLDRFGLCVNVAGVRDPRERMEIMLRRLEFEKDPESFSARFAPENAALAERIVQASENQGNVEASDELLLTIARYCLEVGVDGHRADLTMLKTALTLAAYRAQTSVSAQILNEAAAYVLPHRLRRSPMQELSAEAFKPPLINGFENFAKERFNA